MTRPVRRRPASATNENNLAEPTVKPLRVVLFIDYENARNAAADLFEIATDNASDRRKLGHFHPWALGEAIRDQFNRNAGPTGKRPGRDLLLTQVRVYCGVPDPDWHPNGHAALRAHNKRVSVWRYPPRQVLRRSAQVEVEVIAHSLQYPAARYSSSRERKEFVEKEVDTSIAMDVVSSTKVECDVAILWTEDGDLRPAVRYAIERSLRGHADDGVQIHLAGWRRKKRKRILAPDRHGDKWPDGNVHREHLMSRPTYDHVKDETDYEAVAAQRGADDLERHYNNAEPVDGRLMEIPESRTGVFVRVVGIEVFVPFYRLIGGRQVVEEFSKHRWTSRRFVVRGVKDDVSDDTPKRKYYELEELGLDEWRWSEFRRLYEAGEIFEGKIQGCNSGGVFLRVLGVEAFVPMSEIAGFTGHPPQLSEYVGSVLFLQIIALKRRPQRGRSPLVLRAVLTETTDGSQPSAATSGSDVGRQYKHGDFVVGRVTKVMGHGVRVLIDDRDGGFVDKDDLAPGKEPSEVVEEGALIPLVVRNPLRSGGPSLSLLDAREEAEAKGWVFDNDGRVAPPDALATEAGTEQDS